MSVRTVVAKDLRDVRRAKLVWFVGGLYTLLTALFVVQVRLGGLEGDGNGGANPLAGLPDVLAVLWNVAFVGAVFVPAIALVTAYLAIAGERESGTVRVLLSTPISRRDVVLGKYVSRAAVVAASLVLAFAVAAALVSIWFASLRPGVFLGIAALTAVYALAYVAVAIAVSAATASRARAMAGAIGFYFATNLVTLFDETSGLAALEYVLNDLLALGIGESAIQFLGMVSNPTRAYLVATVGVFPDELTATAAFPVANDLAWYAGPESAAVVLLAWLCVPIWFGVRRFERADIT